MVRGLVIVALLAAPIPGSPAALIESWNAKERALTMALGGWDKRT
jgi:hypothetical protein